MSPLLPLPARGTRQPEECQTVPACTGNRHGYRAERGIMPVLIPESLGEDLDQNVPSFPFPAEQSARQGQAAVRFPAILPSARHPDRFAAHDKEVARRNHSQVSIPCDLVRPRASPFREISFGQGLQTPGDPPEEMFPMPGSRFFLKYLPILLAQSRQARSAQVLNFHQYRRVHVLLLSVAVVSA